MKHFWENEFDQEQTENLFVIMEKLCIAYKFFSGHYDGIFSDFYRYTCNIEKIFETFEYHPNGNNDKITKAESLIKLAIDKNNQDTVYLDYWNYLCEKYEVWESILDESLNSTFIVSKCYEIISPESAEYGDFEETGFEFENESYTFNDLKRLIENEGFSREGITGWLQTIDAEHDYSTGNETYYTLHFENDEQFELVCLLLNL